MTPNPGTNGEDMAYDSATSQLAFVGGGTWVLRDSKWRRVSVLQPMITAIVFDPLSEDSWAAQVRASACGGGTGGSGGSTQSRQAWS